MLLNVFATELQEQIHNQELEPDIIFNAVKSLHKRIQGSYASIALISGHGLLAFRDPFGIRPLVIGKRISLTTKKEEWMVASESLVLENNDYKENKNTIATLGYNEPSLVFEVGTSIKVFKSIEKFLLFLNYYY